MWERVGGSQLKAVVEDQAKWRANCWFECSMRWNVGIFFLSFKALSNYTFTLANLKGNKMVEPQFSLLLVWWGSFVKKYCSCSLEKKKLSSFFLFSWRFFFILMMTFDSNACLLLAMPLHCYSLSLPAASWLGLSVQQRHGRGLRMERWFLGLYFLVVEAIPQITWRW